MKVYFIRHGQTERNLLGLWSGWADVPLTEKGRSDAERVGKTVRHIPFDRVYTSDLVRARETARIALPSYVAEPTALLRELDVGRIIDDRISDMSEEELKKTDECGFAAYGGESNGDLDKRILSFLSEIEAAECENIAVFTHGGVLCEMLELTVGVRLPREKYLCRNCAVLILDITDGVRRLHSWRNLTD